MKAFWSGILLLTALLAGPLQASAQDAKAAETFVRTLYKRYQTEKDFNPIAKQASVNAIATPSLAALFKRDQETSRAAQDGSGLDYDPVCGSQDPGHIELAGLKVQPGGAGKAVALASVRDGKEVTTRRLLLQTAAGEWRIDDITDEKGKDSIRAAISESISLHAKAKR